MESLSQYLSIEVMHIALYQYLLAFLAVLGGFVLKQISSWIMSRLLKVTRKTRFRIDDIFLNSIAPPLGWALLIGGIYLATLALPLPEDPVDVWHFVNALVRSALAVLFVWFGIRLIDQLTDMWMEKAIGTETRLDEQFIPIVRSSSKVFFVIIGIVLFLQNLGYSVTSLLAGVGLGGAAIALASKDTLSNLFGSLVIFMDRPFHIGDWIEVGNIEGTVEEVGLRTTRIRTFANSVVTLPNASLTTTAINNWSRMKKRRIKTTIGLTYDTAPEKMKEAVNMIRGLIKDDPNIRDDFYLVNFDSFGPYSLDILIYCFTVTTNWAEFLNAKQAFLLNIMSGIHALGLKFAFPTQSLHLESLPGEIEALTRDRPH
jgi:MscS family membrane protein